MNEILQSADLWINWEGRCWCLEFSGSTEKCKRYLVKMPPADMARIEEFRIMRKGERPYGAN